jgi:hypothetical protein
MSLIKTSRCFTRTKTLGMLKLHSFNGVTVIEIMFKSLFFFLILLCVLFCLMFWVFPIAIVFFCCLMFGIFPWPYPKPIY